MIVNNEDVGFKFELSDEFLEMKREAFSHFGINEAQAKKILHSFVVLNDKNQIVRSITLTKDGECKSEEQLKKIFNLNLTNMLKFGYEILGSFHVEYTSGRTAEKVVFKIGNNVAVMYMAKVKDFAIGSTALIVEENDNLDKEISTIFSTIVE